MKFYYTGAFKGGDVQTEPGKSLGGYVSQSVIPNSFLGNIFSGVSRLTFERNIQDTKAVVLKNETGVDVKNINFYFNIPITSPFGFKVAFVQLAKDDCGDYMEKLPNSESLPYSGTFYEPFDQAHKINIGDLDKDAILGIWLQRYVKSNPGNTTCQQLYDNYKTGVTDNEVQETVQIILSWT